MKKLFAIIIALLAVVLTSCLEEAGAPVTKEFAAGNNYDELEISNAFDVYVDPAATAVTITAGENLMQRVVVTQQEGTLKIYHEPFLSLHPGELKAIIPYSAALKSIDMSGAGSLHSPIPVAAEKVDIEISGAARFLSDIAADEVDFDLSGACSFKGQVLASKLDMEISGAAELDLTGHADALTLDVSGACKMMDNVVDGMYSFMCNTCEGLASGACKLYIHCTESINVSLSGAGELHYTGSAATTGSSTSGASKIIHDVF